LKFWFYFDFFLAVLLNSLVLDAFGRVRLSGIAAEAALDGLYVIGKVATRKLKEGSPVHSFRALLDELSTIVRNTCEARLGHKAGTTFPMTTMPNPAQRRALGCSSRSPCSHTLDRPKRFNSLI
jgi:hypothetical protein